MLSRRRWRIEALVILSGIVGSSLAFAVVPPLPKTAADMEASHGKASVAITAAVLLAAPSAVADRDTYAKNVIAEFKNELNSKDNPDARLNAAILMAQLQTLSSDSILMDMLKNADPTVRYWGAKGLAGIVPSMKLIGVGNVVTALRAAVKVEKSGVVLQELVKALALYEDLGGVLDGLDAVGILMKASISDKGILDAATLGMRAAGKSINTASSADKQRAAAAATLIMSLAAQQQMLALTAQEAIGQTLDKSYTTAVTNLLDAATKLLNDASGKVFGLHGATLPPEQLLNVKGITGDGTTPGEIQKAMPQVPIPPTLKTNP